MDCGTFSGIAMAQSAQSSRSRVHGMREAAIREAGLALVQHDSEADVSVLQTVPDTKQRWDKD